MSLGRQLSVEELAQTQQLISNCLANSESSNELVLSIEVLEAREWVVRLSGQDKEFITVQIQLNQRSLTFQSYVMGSPQENEASVFSSILKRNRRLRGLHFAIGAEDAIYLVGKIESASVDCAAIDQVLGSVYEAVEASFLGLLHEGFASHFAKE